jgi:hypothetical protein
MTAPLCSCPGRLYIEGPMSTISTSLLPGLDESWLDIYPAAETSVIGFGGEKSSRAETGRTERGISDSRIEGLGITDSSSSSRISSSRKPRRSASASHRMRGLAGIVFRRWHTSRSRTASGMWLSSWSYVVPLSTAWITGSILLANGTMMLSMVWSFRTRSITEAGAFLIPARRIQQRWSSSFSEKRNFRQNVRRTLPAACDEAAWRSLVMLAISASSFSEVGAVVEGDVSLSRRNGPGLLCGPLRPVTRFVQSRGLWRLIGWLSEDRRRTRRCA